MPAFRTVVASHNAHWEKETCFPTNDDERLRRSGVGVLEPVDSVICDCAWFSVLSRSLLAAGVGGKQKRYHQGFGNGMVRCSCYRGFPKVGSQRHLKHARPASPGR